MPSVETGRKWLRYATTEFDTEIEETMEAAIMDMEAAGGYNLPEDPRINVAIRNYLRWQFNFCDRGPEYEKAYEELRNSIAMGYTKEPEGTNWTASCT